MKNYNFGNKENLIEFLKQKLSINIETYTLNNWVDIDVEVILDGEIIKEKNSSRSTSSEHDYFS